MLARPSVARADETKSPYRLKWEVDAPILGLSTAAALTALVGYPPVSCLPNCTPPKTMLGIDDAAVGNYSNGAHSLANVVVASLVFAPLVIDAADSRFKGWSEDSAVFIETILAAQGLTQLTKSAVDRPAPLVYNPNTPRADLESADAGRSFVSGHTATAFSAATAYSVTFWKRHPTSPWRFVVLGVSEALALGVGVLKVKAGYHYPTDVAAGALLGASMGVLLPMMHAEW